MEEYRTAEDLLRQVEILRRSLGRFVRRANLSTKEIVMLSRRIDRLLNRYHNVKEKSHPDKSCGLL